MTLELETVRLNDLNTIPSGVSDNSLRIRQSGIAKVLWRDLDVEVPESTIISNGVNLFRD